METDIDKLIYYIEMSDITQGMTPQYLSRLKAEITAMTDDEVDAYLGECLGSERAWERIERDVTDQPTETEK